MIWLCILEAEYGRWTYTLVSVIEQIHGGTMTLGLIGMGKMILLE